MTETHIWWIRRDIRLQDNPTLTAALEGAKKLIPLFILEPALMDSAAPRRRAFLLNALADLDRQLSDLGSRLIVRRGPAADALPKLSHELGDAPVFAQEDFSPFARSRDRSLQKQIDLTLLPGQVLRRPDAVLKADDDPYTIFTPYKNRWLEGGLPLPAQCLPAPGSLPPLPEDLESFPPPKADPVTGFPAATKEAQRRLEDFAANELWHYGQDRDRMDLDDTSRLSPYLRFGLLSPRECFARAQSALNEAADQEDQGEILTWINELIWREFFIMILFHHQGVLEGPFREEYTNIPWRDASDDLHDWQQGQTGYPAVDACMRQLLNTGWMHNRGRMIVASFLTKDLLINWQEGEAWFMAHLIDGDPAANNGGWQWTAGTGTDAAPYFRIFNPVLQGKKFDPEGDFIARWVPELADLPPKYRHEPWKLPAAQARELGFTPGRDYPERIVDHKAARQRTLDAYKFARESFQKKKK
jgi:deoxyribodipyrimidine photo-lyase